MSISGSFYAYKRLREQPLWKLLSAERAPLILGLLQNTFVEGVSTLPESTLLDRMAVQLDLLRDIAEEVSTPQAYVAEWVSKGWLGRRLPAGASEEVYELSADALAALRFVSGALKPRTLATESRLSLVIQQLSRLSQETDANPQSRLQTLLKDRQRIDDEIRRIGTQGVSVLAPQRALERTREIISLAEELSTDFRSVRDEFEKLNRELRQSLMEHEGSRADVLEKLFAGVDVITESEAGKSFEAFWKMLTDVEQHQELQQALYGVLDRPFSRELSRAERTFLQGLTRVLMAEGGNVHDVLQSLARSLKTFVKSREYQEQRRLNAVLKAANVAAALAKDHVRANQKLDVFLDLPTIHTRSVSQLRLHDPQEQVKDEAMLAGETLELEAGALTAHIMRSEIDLNSLRKNIEDALSKQFTVGIEQLIRDYGAPQGLGSLVGYLSLALKQGFKEEGKTAHVHWNTLQGQPRSVRVAEHVFSRTSYARKR